MSSRDALDRYYTPDSVAMKLVAAIPELGVRVHPLTVLEPSCGGGAFMRAIRGRWPDAQLSGVDADPDAPVRDNVGVTIADFLTVQQPYDLTIGNPPFNAAEEHVRHALKLSRVGVGFLLRLAFLESTKREAFWREHRPARVFVLSRRPSFTGGGTDSAAYGFFWWDLRQRATRTELDWIWSEVVS
jgi:hypothetical protein